MTRPAEITLPSGRQFWAARHDSQNGTLLEFWYSEVPDCSDMGRHFDIRNIPGYFAASHQHTTVEVMKLIRAEHGQILAAFLDTGGDPMAVEVAARKVAATAWRIRPAADGDDSVN